MLRLIEGLAARLLPRPLHRTALRMAHATRHRWRVWRGVRLEGVSIVARDTDGNILLVRHAYGPPVWTLPGGGMLAGETPLAAACRETREELGTDLADPRYCGTVEETLSGSPHTAHVVTGTIGADAAPDRREIAAIRFAPAGDLPLPISPFVAARLDLAVRGIA